MCMYVSGICAEGIFVFFCFVLFCFLHVCSCIFYYSNSILKQDLKIIQS